MKKKNFVVMLCLAIVCALAVPRALRADEWNQATKLTFSESVEIPGKILPAGTYWFTLANSTANRNIVQVWTEDRSHLVTTILAITDYKLKSSGKTVIHFEERPSGQPEAIHSWFYPGETAGVEFVYPRTRASQLAQQTKRPVLSMPDEQASSAAPTAQAPVVAVTPSGEEIEVAQIVASEPVDVPQQASNDSLPKTASPIPLLGFLGVVSLAFGLALRLTMPRA